MKNASKYYKLYRKELANYIESLEKEQAEKEQIDDSKERLMALDEHITAIDSGATDRKLSLFGQKAPQMKMVLSKSDTTGIRAFEEMIKKQKEKGDSLAITLELVD